MLAAAERQVAVVESWRLLEAWPKTWAWRRMNGKMRWKLTRP
jgi:hypothetical protein